VCNCYRFRISVTGAEREVGVRREMLGRLVASLQTNFILRATGKRGWLAVCLRGWASSRTRSGPFCHTVTFRKEGQEAKP
jgi:hypothetical protein